MKYRHFRRKQFAIASAIVAAAGFIGSETIAQRAPAEPGVKDPGVRGGSAGAGGQLPGLSKERFDEFQRTFNDDEGVADGLGPRFNLDSCGGCHSYPAIGGSSGRTNPQIELATKEGAQNTIPWFISKDGPIREARRVRGPDGSPDGGVVPLFVITGRSDAPGCNIRQPDFSNRNNFIFRIPTPVFGMGLIEAIPDKAIRDNLGGDTSRKRGFGIQGRLNTSPEGRLNTSGNDGTVTRFGWKAQNKSALVFAGEAYNVEMGITNDLFPNEREDACANPNGIPEDHVDFTTKGAVELGDVVPFAVFMRFLDQPRPAAGTNSTRSGRRAFDEVGCALCHTPTLTTGKSSIPALSEKKANLYSDLALHKMGTGLADGVTQGQAGPTEFRTAPLWGLGQRVFFLHDGRTADLIEAIQQHASPDSEAKSTVEAFNRLSRNEKQDLLNFLRSL